MIWAILADGIVTYILFIRFQKFREIRGRQLPLCILTSLHTLLIPLFIIAEAYRSGRPYINTVADVLRGLYLFSPLVLLLFGIISFAFSTILGWSYYGEKGIEFLTGTRARIPYRIVYVIFTFLGGVMPLAVVWNISDLANGMMCIPNLVCVLALSGVIVRETRKANLL